MEQKDKELLLKDLSARLSYGVICNTPKGDGHLNSINQTIFDVELGINVDAVHRDTFKLENCKPYLRPMSSMTEEEKIQLSQYACIGEDLNGEFIDEVQRKDCATYVDWLNKNMFDYRDLILKGLALEAPEGMYTLKVR